MNIEAIVKKHARLAEGMRYWDAELLLRAALTELAAGYENLIIALNREVVEANERIRQLDARLGGYLTVGGGHIVHGTAEALARVQAYILLDSKHPIEARDTNRYFAKQLQTAEQRIRQLEAERVPDDAAIIRAMSIAGATDKEWKALTYESGAYDITKPTVFLQRLAKVLAAAPQQKKEG